MELITLLTDYNHKDFYLAKVKSRLKKHFPNHSTLDISHGVSTFDLKEASYAFNALISEFDGDNIHFILVNIHYEKNYSFVIAETKDHGLIVAPNNGILGLINCDYINFYKLELDQKESFIELTLIEKLKNIDLSALQKIETTYLLKEVSPRITEKELRGEVIYIDSYGNCITNITKTVFEEFVNNESYHIVLRRNNIIERISLDYSDNWEAGPAIFFNEQGNLEVSSVHGNASALFGLKYESRIIVKKN